MKTYQRIKNFSTTIAVEKTISEIEKMLSIYGATKILKEFDSEGNPTTLSFIIATSKGEMPVQLPMRHGQIMNVFKMQVSKGKLPSRFWGTPFAKEQAARVGWRIIKDWLDAQLTLLNIEMVKIEEIFLPYIYNPTEQKTMYELIEEKGFDILQLEKKEETR